MSRARNLENQFFFFVMERILETRTLETEDFINRSSKIHNNKYDYSETVYVRANEKVIIICHKHGEFKQLPRNHVKGIGCRKCGFTKRWENNKKTTEQFINEARLIHGYRYDYSLVVYKSSENKVDIICKKHGAFSQVPSSHLSGQGCPPCGLDKATKSRTKTEYKFIEDAIKIHRDKYDYSLVKYKNTHTKINIICRDHGVFKQTPGSHLSGSGCFECGKLNISKHNEENPRGWGPSNWESSAKKSKEFDSFKVYVIKCWNDSEVFYKIGRTFMKTKLRFRTKRLMPYNYGVIYEFVFKEAKEAFDYENKMRRINKENKYIPLIKFGGRHECFKCIPVI